MVLTLLRIQEHYKITMDPAYILELDSTTSTKFSRHVIITLPGAAFASTLHAGAFVRSVCGSANALTGPLSVRKVCEIRETA